MSLEVVAEPLSVCDGFRTCKEEDRSQPEKFKLRENEPVYSIIQGWCEKIGLEGR
jgi:hypothetical protein